MSAGCFMIGTRKGGMDMHDKIFPNPAVEAKHRSGLVGAHFDCFVNWMQTNGYTRNAMRYNVQKVTHFGQYLQRRGIRSIHQLEGMGGKKLLDVYRRYCKRRGLGHRGFGLKFYLQALREAGVVASLASKDFLLLPLTQQYLTFLRNQGNLAETTIHRHIGWVEKFLRFLGGADDVSISTLGIADVDRFIEQEALRLRHPPHRSFVHALRSFFRFLHHSGKIGTDFSYLIHGPRRYKLQFLPTVLAWSEVKRILNSVDRLTKAGLQHYAILLLLTTYGLRAGEVAQLKLEDIDWRKETVRIVRRKMGKDLWLPLTSQVGKSILEYLRQGRPFSKYREIFLCVRAPWTPLSGSGVSYVVRKYIQIADLNPSQRGAHLIRHSFATHLIRQGASLKQIGDILGHRNLESTHIYTKTAVERLREVALEIPEVK